MKPALILAAGYSAPLFKPEMGKTYDIFCLNHAYRLFEPKQGTVSIPPDCLPLSDSDSKEGSSNISHVPASLPVALAHTTPHNFCCLDHPRYFSADLLTNKHCKIHTCNVHERWLSGCPNYQCYEFEKGDWSPPRGDPFIRPLLQKPYMTFLFALQIIVHQGYESISFLGCDFNLTQDQNYYFSSELTKQQFDNKFRAQERTLEVFARWIQYLDDTELVSLSPQSRLNEWIQYKTLL